jgi:hypothetical protein
MQKYISLLSIVQSQPTHTPSTRNQATGFSFKEPSSGLCQKLWKTNSMHFVRGKLVTKYMEFVFHSLCHRPVDGSLKLKPVAWLRVESVCVGCDCAVYKSEICFCILFYMISLHCVLTHGCHIHTFYVLYIFTEQSQLLCTYDRVFSHLSAVWRKLIISDNKARLLSKHIISHPLFDWGCFYFQTQSKYIT